VNGSLALETPLTRGEHYFAKTTNGDIRISVPTGTGAIVQMRTTNGELSCDLPTDVINRSRRNWQGRINDGGATLELETLNGDVLIEESAFSGAREAGPAPEAPPPPQAPAGLDTDWTPEPPEMPDIPGMPDLSEMPDPGSGISMQTPEAPGSDARSTEHRVDYGSADSISILTRLERGEITIEEAMEKLDALR
jgi:hypothetical protein